MLAKPSLPSSGRSWEDASRKFVTRVDILDLIIQNVVLPDILQVIVMLVEREIPGTRASILLLDDDRAHLHVGAGPSLPAAFHEAVDGASIGSGIGTCGTAAYEQRVVITPSIAEDPAWDGWRPAAEAAGLAACWSTPFLGLHDRVLGTFAVYFDHAREPTESELAVLHDAGYFAAVAVQHDATRRLLDDQRRVHPITGIANRAVLLEQLARAQAAAAESGGCFAVIQISVEGLSSINEWLGPSVGDQVLRVTARRLSDVVADAGLAAHVWGCDFVVLAAASTSENDAIGLAERLRAAATEPLEVEGMMLQVGATVGVAVCHESPAAPRAADEPLRNANVALRRARAGGSDRIGIYDAAVDPGAHVTLLAPALLHGIEHEDLALAYQPIVALATSEVDHYEALLRWTTAQGAVPPSSFVPVAERTGAVSDLGRYALRQALAELHRQRAHGQTFGMSVNLSARQLSDDGVTDLLADLIAEYQLPAGSVTLEVTEGVLVAANTGWKTLARMRQLGARISLDDFGVGFSQISYLRRFRFDEIKIDRSFVRDMHNDDTARAIIVAAIAFARATGMSIVAEGIENQRQADMLVDMGCTHGQGYLFGAAGPVPTQTAARRG